MTQAQLLAKNIDFARKYTLFFFSKLKDSDLHQRFEVNGVHLNSAYWIMAHLCMTENWILLRSTGGEMERFSWAKLFGMGSSPPVPKDCPPFEEIVTTSKLVHQKGLIWVASLSDEQLDKEHKLGFSIGPEGTVREALMHTARHEAGHAGQLGWICAMQGIETI